MKTYSLPKQPPMYWSYFVVGRLLYFSMWLFILESWLFGHLLMRSLQADHHWIWQLWWLICFGFSFVHIFLVMADGWSRFQNYKRIKDQLFIYGFQTRIIHSYMRSKCQRMAAETAADELGLGEEVRAYYYGHGYRWYHFVPDFMVRDPLFLFRSYFWNRTFLEKYYQPKFDYRKMELEIQST